MQRTGAYGLSASSSSGSVVDACKRVCARDDGVRWNDSLLVAWWSSAKSCHSVAVMLQRRRRASVLPHYAVVEAVMCHSCRDACGYVYRKNRAHKRNFAADPFCFAFDAYACAFV